MLPIAASSTFGLSTSRFVPSQSFREPTRPYFAPYMKPHTKVDTTAGTAYGRNVVMRKNFAPCSFMESKAKAIAADRNSMMGTCTMVNRATRHTELQNCWSWNRRM